MDFSRMINLNLEEHKITPMPFVFDMFKNSYSNFHPLKAPSYTQLVEIMHFNLNPLI